MDAFDPALLHPARPSWVNKEHQIEVYEASNGFYICDLKTAQTKGMGDGVDMFSVELNEEPWSRTVMVGTDEFYREMEQYVATEGATLREAYFGGEG